MEANHLGCAWALYTRHVNTVNLCCEQPAYMYCRGMRLYWQDICDRI